MKAKTMDDYYLDPTSDSYMTTSEFTKAEAPIFWVSFSVSLCIALGVPTILVLFF